MASDAFVVGEEWISEHYFSTDAKSQSFSARVLQRRALWDELTDDSIPTPRSRFVAIRGALASSFAQLAEITDAADLRERIYTPLRTALGFAAGTLDIDQSGPLTLLRPSDLTEGASVALIEAVSVEQFDDLLQRDAETLLEPYIDEDDDKHRVQSVARLLSLVFLADAPPEFAVVIAGHWALITERTRWPEGRYLALDLQLVVDRNHAAKGGELDQAVASLAAESFIPTEEGVVWWREVLADSIKHTVGVSQDLRDGVRSSIELIANDVVTRRSELGLAPLPASEAQALALQSLRYLYRILFLLFAEASPELAVVPAVVNEYEEGYGLGRLRELVQVELTHDAASRRHIYDSLAILFRQVDQGHAATPPGDGGLHEGLTFDALKADLFAPQAISLIDEVGLSDGELQRVLAHLLLSKERKGSDRGFISYANLGINQLGAVYEGLMSYTGFFAETDLFEVARDGDSSKGSWVVPVERSHDIELKHFVSQVDELTGETKPVLHPAGSFVYRLAGRERQQSASYYTPEVLTRFVVSQALAELLTDETKAAEILTMTVCEPALGSGAFAIEAVRQLAQEYLSRRERELDTKVDPDQYPMELQKVKASIALHQVYGVDLNSTAVELAEISLWLDTMVRGLDAPWFGLHLRRGNSLIGARRAVYSRDQVTSKAWLTAVPRDVSVLDLAENLKSGTLASGTAGAIHHFLLPAAGWGSATEAKEARDLAPDAFAALKSWRRSITSKLSKKQTDQLVGLSYRVETLWQFALRRLEIAEREVRRSIDLWGDDGAVPVSGGAVQRDEIELKLNDPDGAIQRLRRVMDAWNALWFWPLTDTLTAGAQPPTIDEWIAGLTAVVGTHVEVNAAAARHGAVTLAPSTNWADLGVSEQYDLDLASAQSISQVLAAHPWLGASERIAAQQGFFHWELDFVTVFARGGFDLQVGNPPWVRPRSDVEALLAEGDPWWQLSLKPTQAQVAAKRAETLHIDGLAALVVDGTTDVAALASFVGAEPNFSLLASLQPDLYRCFMAQTWSHQSRRGITALIHLETHFTDERAGSLRAEVYKRLRRHWDFINELKLFEIQDQKRYGVNIYGARRSSVRFISASSLYHPDTVERSLRHDGSGLEPGFKDEAGNWDLRPHSGRIVEVDDQVLAKWHSLLEGADVPLLQTRMVYANNQTTAKVLAMIARHARLGSLGLFYSRGWDESIDRRKGYFALEWGAPRDWPDVILQGPHLFVNNPFYKSPNESMRNQQDWSQVDLESLADDIVPTTAYKPTGDRRTTDAAYTHWGEEKYPARSAYRVAWRRMAANTGERTLAPSIFPPGPAFIQTVVSAGRPNGDDEAVVIAAGYMSSLLADSMIRSSPKSDILFSTAMKIPGFMGSALSAEMVLRVLRLNCLSDAYGDLWNAVRPVLQCSGWSGGLDYQGRPALDQTPDRWDGSVALRRDSDRRQAAVEIDAIVAIELGVSADELCTIYRTQFAVLYGYDHANYYYDANGRLVPNSVLTVWRKRSDAPSADERTVTNASGTTYTYELPFVTLDREADMRQAYAHFERVLAERS
jgi:hypothetical protein